MKKRLIATVLACFTLILTFSMSSIASQLDTFADLEGTIDIAGGTAHIPVMKDAAKSIMKKYPAVHISVAGGGSGIGVQKVGEGLVDIGNAGRPVSGKEKKKYQNLHSFPFAVDGVAPTLHPANPVENLSSSQIQDIFAGKITNWKDVGGSDAEIHLYSRDEASGTRSVFWKKCLKKGMIADFANIVPSNGAMKGAVSRDQNALGYMSIGHLDNTVKAVQLNDIAPTQENAINGSYPVVRKLFMNTNGEPKPLVKAFIDYVLSSDGAKSIESHGYIPLI